MFLLLKFGGTSVGDVERIQNAAAKVAAEVERGHKVAVVVSAMAGVTDQLVNYCHAITPLYDAREYDAVVASGEQVTSGLMALALQQRGLKARSWQGWQVPLRTNTAHGKARIEAIEADAVRACVLGGEIAVMAGFQGISPEGRITTLGRGGSDTSAVALAIALKADRCDIYTDVDGVYTTDPRIVAKAQKIPRVGYREMLELASLGAKVLQTRSVEIAMRHAMQIQVLSTFESAIGSDLPGTLITDGDKIVEQKTVTGIAYSRSDAKVTIIRVSDHPGVAADVFVPLAKAGINVDMIVQAPSEDGKTTDITFTIPRADLDRTLQVLESAKAKLGFSKLSADSNVAKISLVGAGMSTNPGVAAKMFEVLAEKKINIQVIETSEISISVLIEEPYMELAVRALHTAFGLDGE